MLLCPSDDWATGSARPRESAEAHTFDSGCLELSQKWKGEERLMPPSRWKGDHATTAHRDPVCVLRDLSRECSRAVSGTWKAEDVG